MLRTRLSVETFHQDNTVVPIIGVSGLGEGVGLRARFCRGEVWSGGGVTFGAKLDGLGKAGLAR